MRRRTLFTQVLAVNAAVICVATVAGALLTDLDPSQVGRLIAVAVIAAAFSLTLNLVLLRRQFRPLDDLIEEMERVDLSRPGANLPASIDGSAETEEVERLELAFLRMMRRLEAERRRSSSAALSAQEQERARVARDLHDEVNQSLTGVLLRLEALRAEAPPALESEIAETQSLAHQAMEELLEVARRLRPTALDDLGLTAAIAGQVEQISEGGSIAAEFAAEGDLSGLDPETQLVIYRVVQESLSNAIRHSGAGRIEVELRRAGGRVELVVRDDGEGFAFAESDKGLGLSGMRERALLVGGELSIESGQGDGTTVRLSVRDRVPQRLAD